MNDTDLKTNPKYVIGTALVSIASADYLTKINFRPLNSSEWSLDAEGRYLWDIDPTPVHLYVWRDIEVGDRVFGHPSSVIPEDAFI